MRLGERISERAEELGISQSELARRVGTSQATIWKLLNGESNSTKFLYQIAQVLEVTPDYLLGLTNEPKGHLPSMRAEDRFLEVPMIDLAYGMGGTYLDDEPEVRTEAFPLAFIRRYTAAKAENLVFAEGVGDSMAPTIHTTDLLLIDQSDQTLRLSDQIWAFSYGGVGMVKRLRPRPDGSVAILSDNPNVPEDKAVDDEMHLIGRVVAKVSKL